MNRFVFPKALAGIFLFLSCVALPARAEESPPLAGMAYVTSCVGTVSVTDTDKDQVVKTIPVPKAPEGIAVKR